MTFLKLLTESHTVYYSSNSKHTVFRGKLLDWLKSFLTNRKQRVVCGDHESDWATVLSGVPQGSVLGLLLFLVFINDLPELVTHYCKLFADDTKLIGVVKNSLDQKILQEDIDKLVNWSKKWNMEFNEGKCKVMNIGGHKSIAPMLSMENSSGERVVLHETRREKD